jgi:hypothetical protein
MSKVATAADLIVVLVFAGIGRAAHAHGLTVTGLASTAWPFLAGLAIGWCVLTVGRRDGTSVSGGLVVWISTVVFGMIIRVISGQGTAVAFVFVALAFLGLAMVSWRALIAWLRHGRLSRSTPEVSPGP